VERVRLFPKPRLQRDAKTAHGDPIATRGQALGRTANPRGVKVARPTW